MFIQIDKGIYEKLSEAEKGVIQFLNQNEEKDSLYEHHQYCRENLHITINGIQSDSEMRLSGDFPAALCDFSAGADEGASRIQLWSK